MDQLNLRAGQIRVVTYEKKVIVRQGKEMRYKKEDVPGRLRRSDKGWYCAHTGNTMSCSDMIQLVAQNYPKKMTYSDRALCTQSLSNCTLALIKIACYQPYKLRTVINRGWVMEWEW